MYVCMCGWMDTGMQAKQTTRDNLHKLHEPQSGRLLMISRAISWLLAWLVANPIAKKHLDANRSFYNHLLLYTEAGIANRLFEMFNLLIEREQIVLFRFPKR
jgi:hypothetical protein